MMLIFFSIGIIAVCCVMPYALCVASKDSARYSEEVAARKRGEGGKWVVPNK